MKVKVLDYMARIKEYRQKINRRMKVKALEYMARINYSSPGGVCRCGSAGPLLQQRVLAWSSSVVELARRTSGAIAIRGIICSCGLDRPCADPVLAACRCLHVPVSRW